MVLALLIPPHGILSDNEENYFALAERFVAGSALPRTTAVFDASPHRVLSDATLGALIAAIGYVPAQIVARLLAVAGYALVLPPLFAVFALSALDAALAVMALALIGQDLMGGEWLFGDYEAKVAAYVLVLTALRRVLTEERLGVAVLLFALATWWHFLVGGFWFVAAMGLRLLDRPRDLRRVLGAAVLFALLVAPLCGVIVWSRLADHSAARVGDLPTPDVIYSVIREPHHQSPFLTWQYFRENWLPGYVEAAAMLVVCLGIARWGATRRWRVMAVWLAGLLAYLFVVLGPKYLDRDSGVLGKFYLFRPSSLTLFLWLLLVIAVAIGLAGRRAWLLRAALIAGIALAFVYLQGDRLVREVSAHQALDVRKRAFEAAVMRATGAGAVVLIDPSVEMQFLDFERRTGRPTWVMWKFAPTNDADLLTWYRRMEVRRVLFERGCGVDAQAASIDFLLTTPEHAAHLTATCGPGVARVDDWVLLRRAADH